MAVAARDPRIERRDRAVRLVALPALARRSSLSDIFELWETSWRTALAALDGAVRLGAVSSRDAAVRRRRIGDQRELVAGELRELARDGGLSEP